MKSKRDSILTNSVLYTTGNLLLKAFSFFLIPLYTAYLSTEEYGLVNLSSGFYTVASSILMLGLQYAVIRYYADYKENQDKVGRMFGTTICFVFLLGIIFLLICFPLKYQLSQWFFNGISFFPIVFLSVIISITTALYTIYQDILKGMQNAKGSVILSYVFFFLQLGSNIVTVVVLHKGAVGILLSTFIINSIMLVIMLLDLIRKKLFIFGLDMPILKDMLLYSLPLVPHTIAYNLSSYAAKVIISTNLSLSVLGLFSLASQFGNVSDIVLNSVQSAFQPWMYGMLNSKSESSKKNIAKTSYMLMWLYGLLFILIGIFSQEAIIIMSSQKDYISAWQFVPVIVLAVALKSPLYFYQNLLYYDKAKTKYVFVSTLVGSIVNIILTWILVPVFQVMGSIIADVISMFVRLFITIGIVRHDAKSVFSILKLETLSIIPMVFMGIAIIPSYLWFKEEISIQNVMIKIVVVLLYIGFASYCNRTIIREKVNQFRH